MERMYTWDYYRNMECNVWGPHCTPIESNRYWFPNLGMIPSTSFGEVLTWGLEVTRKTRVAGPQAMRPTAQRASSQA